VLLASLEGTSDQILVWPAPAREFVTQVDAVQVDQ
jgi:hypothetical protein